MVQAEIRFEREDIEGLMPVGTYLADAARRLGIRFTEPCIDGEQHGCVVNILKGGDLLSEPTEAEQKFFDGSDMGDRRLACHARIDRAGEITVMTKETKKEEPQNGHDEASEKYRKEFADLPLEKKIADLVRLEAMTLGETVSFIMNSPYMVIDKIMDVMAEFGLKKEEAERRTGKPKEHASTESGPGQAEADEPGSGPDPKEEKTQQGKGSPDAATE